MGFWPVIWSKGMCWNMVRAAFSVEGSVGRPVDPRLSKGKYRRMHSPKEIGYDLTSVFGKLISINCSVNLNITKFALSTNFLTGCSSVLLWFLENMFFHHPSSLSLLFSKGRPLVAFWLELLDPALQSLLCWPKLYAFSWGYISIHVIQVNHQSRVTNKKHKFPLKIR